jgi:hypothetical protein
MPDPKGPAGPAVTTAPNPPYQGSAPNPVAHTRDGSVAQHELLQRRPRPGIRPRP